ncbi:GFA family protein [Massilia sp. Dwa41.01b]|uniref:GFA family protein n=1 Tax=unclassified Massilia TaxID=2609279 RepID=UPI0015FEE602|nr:MULTISPECIES: GFA family protein [unclassified Massilia]QNA87536.1 GFA family protein [Massilia sp. Dwa41.01b]QNA98443.1 GFA family protein [Massilia sp. Se16.2.3]
MTSNGTCHCGAIAYAFDGDPVQVLNCHCTMCRTMNGGAFSTYVVIPSQTLRFIRGEADLGAYTVTERTSKHFCPHCATPLFNANPTTYPGLRMLYLGTLRDAAQLRPAINIYCDSKLAWTDNIADMRNVAEGPRRGQAASPASGAS